MMATKTDPVLDWLGHVSLFQGVAPRKLRAIRDSMRERDFHAGDIVVSEGAQEGRFFLIIDGKATATAGGRYLAAFGPGDYFGEISLIDGKPRSASIRPEGAVTTLSLTAWNFQPLLEKHPQLNHELLMGLCAHVRDAEARAEQQG